MTVSSGGFEELCRRIRRSVASGGALQGMKFYETFDMRNEGADHLPRVYVVDYADKESHAGGAPQNSNNGINSVIRTTATVGIQLVVDRKNGWFTDPFDVTNLKKMGAINVKNLLLDAIESDDDGEPDCSFSGALDEPPMFSVRESGVFDLGIVIEISVTLAGRRMNRTTRACVVRTDQALQ